MEKEVRKGGREKERALLVISSSITNAHKSSRLFLPPSRPPSLPPLPPPFFFPGYYINNVEGPRDLVDPLLTRPTGETIRWSAQFTLQPPPGGSSSSSSSRSSTRKCDPTMLCRDVPAWGAYRGAAYAGNGNMKSLVCCDSGFRW